MIFITLGKFRNKPTKEATAQVSELMKAMTKEGVRFVGFYWTLGRYDTVVIVEARARDRRPIRIAGVILIFAQTASTLGG